MTVAFRSSSTQSAAGAGGVIAVPAPAGIVAGDLLLLVWSQDTPGQTLTATGWTQGHIDSVTNGDGQTMGWWWRAATGTDNFSFTSSSTANNQSICAAAYSGVDNVTPFDGVTPSFNNPNLVSVPNSPVTATGTGVTTNTAGDQIVMLAGLDASGNNDNWAANGSLALRQQALSTNQFSTCAIADLNQASAGASGNQTMTWTSSGNNGNFVAYLLALKPAAVGSPGPNPLFRLGALPFAPLAWIIRRRQIRARERKAAS
jgi:hypothetical protein